LVKNEYQTEHIYDNRYKRGKNRVKSSKPIKALPYPIYFWSVFTVAVVGLADAVYLSIAHYRVYTDMAYKSFCAVSKAINCDTVSQSEYSIFLNVPVPIWGLVGYAAFLLMLAISYRLGTPKARMWPTLFIVAIAFSISSILLAWISIQYIHSYCIMCLASHAVSFTLLFLTWLVYRRIGKGSLLSGMTDDVRFYLDFKKRCALIGSGVLLIVILMISFFPSYWKLPQIPSSVDMPTGITEDGHPWIGAVHPQLVITEFTEYQCFQCKKMHFYLRQLIGRYPEKIRLVHRHFPMDHAINPLVKEPYHIGSRKMALLSIFAAQHNRFWVINDMLFQIEKKGNFNIRTMAKVAGFDVHEFAASIRNPIYRHKLKHDISQGIQLGITGTPGYLINGEVYVGQIPPDILSAVN